MQRRWQLLILALLVGLGVIPWATAATSALTLEPPILTLDQGGTASAKVTVALRRGRPGEQVSWLGMYRTV